MSHATLRFCTYMHELHDVSDRDQDETSFRHPEPIEKSRFNQWKVSKHIFTSAGKFSREYYNPLCSASMLSSSRQKFFLTCLSLPG